LIVPDVLTRYVAQIVGNLFAESALRRGIEYLEYTLQPAILRDPLGNHDYLNVTPARKSILPQFFQAVGVHVPDSDYFQIASVMKPEEIHAEVKKKLDEIAAALNPEG
ncbi:MAG: hypothetical protein ACREQF_08840, partial [Candidatus Binataceae bacterium]